MSYPLILYELHYVHSPVVPDLTGRALGLHLVVLLLPGDDDVAIIPANIDDSAEFGRGGVVEVALPSLVLLDYAVLAFAALCIPEIVAFLLSIVSIFYLDGVCNVETHRHVHALVERIRDVVAIVGAVVI
jgi:hypothetical protein